MALQDEIARLRSEIKRDRELKEMSDRLDKNLIHYLASSIGDIFVGEQEDKDGVYHSSAENEAIIRKKEARLNELISRSGIEKGKQSFTDFAKTQSEKREASKSLFSSGEMQKFYKSFRDRSERNLKNVSNIRKQIMGQIQTAQSESRTITEA